MSKHYDRRNDSSSSRSRYDDHRRHRSPSPASSRGRTSPKPRNEKELPKAFGRREETEKEIDDLNILQRMKTSFGNSPLQSVHKYMKNKQKVKIWTRNFKEIRGVMTGYVVAFDKHWNMILEDVDEVFLKPKKSKTPFLREVSEKEKLPDIPAKVPRQKKTDEEKAAAEKAASESDEEIQIISDVKKKDKRKRKKTKTVSERRHVDQLFIRGDNIVMMTPIVDDEEEEVEEVEVKDEPGSD